MFLIEYLHAHDIQSHEDFSLTILQLMIYALHIGTCNENANTWCMYFGSRAAKYSSGL